MLLPVSLCRVQVTESLVVKRCDLFWATSSVVFNWFYQRYRFFISILFLNPYTRNCKDMRPQGFRKETDARGQKTRQTTFHVKFAFVHSLLYRNISHGTPNTRTSSIDITFQLWNIPRRNGNRNPSKSSTGVWKLARNQRQPFKGLLADNNFVLVVLLVMFFTFICHAV